LANEKNLIANPEIVFREEFDDWAILFDPDSGDTFGVNPVSVFIWKLLDGSHNERDILGKLRENCTNVPEEAESEIKEFLDDLVERGFAGYETTVGENIVIEDKKLTYEKPTLILLGASHSGTSGSSDNAEPEESAMCDVGQSAGYLCGLGFSPALLCGEGAGDEG